MSGNVYLRRWFCIDEQTGARFSVRVWLENTKGVMTYKAMRIHGTNGKGGGIFHELEGHEKVKAAFERFAKNTQLVKHFLRDDLAERN